MVPLASIGPVIEGIVIVCALILVAVLLRADAREPEDGDQDGELP